MQSKTSSSSKKIPSWLDEFLIASLPNGPFVELGGYSDALVINMRARNWATLIIHKADPRVRKFALPLASTSLHKTPRNDLDDEDPRAYLDLSLTRWTTRPRVRNTQTYFSYSSSILFQSERQLAQSKPSRYQIQLQQLVVSRPEYPYFYRLY